MPAVAGVTARDTSVVAVTVRAVLPEISPDVAVIVIGPPVAFDVARPLKPGALLMVATAAFEELQVTDDVRSCVVKSEYIPVAINGCCVPRAILRLTGVIPMDDSVALVTVSVVVPVFPVAGSVAVIVIGPPLTFEVASPLEPAVLLMVATVSSEDIQVTKDVRFIVVLSE